VFSSVQSLWWLVPERITISAFQKFSLGNKYNRILAFLDFTSLQLMATGDSIDDLCHLPFSSQEISL